MNVALVASIKPAHVARARIVADCEKQDRLEFAQKLLASQPINISDISILA
jgi:hypothetical protein